MTGIDWEFDRTPPSRSRRGGNPAEYAFEGDLPTFVREVIQNANDQGNEGVEIEFTFVELGRGKRKKFFDAIEWESLFEHIEAVKEADRDRLIAQYIDEVFQERPLLLLEVEDRNTVGLLGSEYEDTSHFSALCRDTLFSHKQDSNRAGGSYGLGKSVLWSFSGISTVLFNSKLSEEPEDSDRTSPRFIGRAELPSHALETEDGEEWFTGSGWFGQIEETEEGHERAVSVWGDEASELAERLYTERNSPLPGTSISIVGFRDPTSDEDRSPEELSDDIRDAATGYFWPALTREHEKLDVLVGIEGDSEPAEAESLPEVLPFVECYKRRHEPDEQLDEAGDVVRRSVEFEIPPERREEGHDGVTGRVTLLVRLQRSVDHDRLQDHVAFFRGPGMVVRYWDKRRMGVGARPFHAVVIAGEGHDPGEVEERDRQTERFLRMAEPPGHDKWISTQSLKEEYKRGYAKALDELHANLRNALRELVIPTPSEGERGPDKLRRRFQLSPRRRDAPSGSSETAFAFRGVRAVFDDNRWRLSGEMWPKVEEQAGWEAEFSLSLVDESGQVLEDVPLETFTSADPTGCRYRVEDGSAKLKAEPSVESLQFGAKTRAFETGSRFDPITSGEVKVRIEGRVHTEE